MRIVESLLLRRLRRSTAPAIASAVSQIVENPEQGTVSEIARRAGLSASRFRKRFIEEVGLSPKHFLRLTRVHALTRCKIAHSGVSLTRLGHLSHGHQAVLKVGR